MSDVTGVTTTLTNSINVCLSVIGEAPVNSITGSSLPTQVALAKQTIEEVGRDVQSKGWWFNTNNADITIYSTDTNNDFATQIPEEARRYITIRAARVLQSRFVSSEELHKFSYNEELVSLATLQQAHVRNGGNSTSFTAFPADLKNLGIEEVMFLQGSAEEKLLTLRLGTELKQQSKIAAETSLLADQEALVEKQVLTEVAQELKVDAETALLTAQELKTDAETALTEDQEALVTQQKLTEVQETIRKTKEAELLDTQETLVSQQKLTEVQETTKRTREHELLDAQETLLQKQILTEAEQVAKVQEEVDLLQSQDTLVQAQATDVGADTTLKGKQGALVDAQELKTDAESALLASQTTTDATQRTLIAAQELKTDAEKLLVDAQASLTADQELKTVAEKQLLESQKTQVDTQTALELTEEKAYSDAITGIASGTTYRDFAAELRMMGVQEPTFYQLPAYKKKEALKDATKLRTSTATETGTDATEIAIVNNIRRMVGEAPITALNGDSMASEAVRMLRKTSTEMQGRGWWFNTEYDVNLQQTNAKLLADVVYTGADEDFPNFDGATGIYTRLAGNWGGVNGHVIDTSTTDGQNYNLRIVDGDGSIETVSTNSNTNTGTLLNTPWNSTFTNATITQVNGIELPSDVLSFEITDYNTIARTLSVYDSISSSTLKLRYLFDLKDRTYSFNKTVKAKVIYERSLDDIPQKFQEYLEVRVAILLTEMYPRDGVDIQRLPRIERELEAYFKDRENDEGNYSIFDNYDTASRIGINRNYDIV